MCLQVLLLEVSTRSFRNLSEARIELGRRTTVLFGPNGQGKTNFLEACHLLCTLRALRARNELLRQDAPPDLLASFDEPLARLGANVRRRREEVLEEIRPHAQQAFAEVARGEAPLELVYLAAGRDSDGLAGAGEA